MNPIEIKHILSEIGGGPNKRLGQNFLIDTQVLDAMVQTAAPAKIGMTLEIGPGLGVLTRALLHAGHAVVAIERDRRFVGYLEKSIHSESFLLKQGDAAELDWDSIVTHPWSLISNLPYSISSLALRKALWSNIPASHITVLVQKEVGERVCNVAGALDKKRGKTSLLSLMVALASQSARIVRIVPAEAFFPPPKVQSAILEIIPNTWKEREALWGTHPENIMRIAKAGFASPRKKLSSNLETHLHLTKELVSQSLLDVGLEPNIRAEDVSPKEWAHLTKSLSVHRV